VFDRLPEGKTDPKMVALATQLIDRQTGTYDPADVEDGYETRRRAVIQAKSKGEGLQPEDGEPADRSNVIDLIAALKKSLASDAREAACNGRDACGREEGVRGTRQAASEEAGRRVGAQKSATRLGAPSPCQ
jgi:DNA end-binding protein Ku